MHVFTHTMSAIEKYADDEQGAQSSDSVRQHCEIHAAARTLRLAHCSRRSGRHRLALLLRYRPFQLDYS